MNSLQNFQGWIRDVRDVKVEGGGGSNCVKHKFTKYLPGGRGLTFFRFEQNLTQQGISD